MPSVRPPALHLPLPDKALEWPKIDPDSPSYTPIRACFRSETTSSPCDERIRPVEIVFLKNFSIFSMKNSLAARNFHLFLSALLSYIILYIPSDIGYTECRVSEINIEKKILW